MAFINIFNYKKYFRKASDSNVARIGHVNALYDALNSNTDYQPKLTTGSVKQTGSNTNAVTINKDAGIIELSGVYNSGTLTFTVNNDKVTSSSIILLTAQTPGTQAFPWGLATSNIQNGSFQIKFFIAPSATALIYKFHFLVINP